MSSPTTPTMPAIPTPPPTTFPPQIAGLPSFEGPFDAFRLAAPGCDVLFASYPAGTVIGEHDHPTDNVGVITAGELILTMDGAETHYGPGDWYRVPPHTTHAARRGPHLGNRALVHHRRVVTSARPRSASFGSFRPASRAAW